MAEEAEDDIGADIMATMAELGGEPAPEPVIAASGDDPEPGEETTGERARDASGKFAKKEVEDTQEKVQSLASPPEGAEPAAPTIQPPHALSATLKAQFATLPPEVQQEFARITGDAQTAKNEWSVKGEKLNRYEALIAPERERLALAGQDEHSYFSALIAADKFLQRDPNAALSELARMYGGQAPQTTQQPGQEQQAHPAIGALQAQVAELSAKLQERASQEEQASQAEAEASITAFRADPKNLYFDNVKPQMAALIRAGQAKDVREAYDKAIWADPEIRPLLLAEQSRAPAPVRKGVPAGDQITGAASPGAKLNGAASKGSIEDDVRASMEEVFGRV